MKIPGPRKNTEKEIERLLHHHRIASVDFIVRTMWPQSKQPHKKAKTVRGYLATLAKRGDARESAPDLWVHTNPRGGPTGGRRMTA